MIQKFLKQMLMFFCPYNELVRGRSIVFPSYLSHSCSMFVTLLYISRGSQEVVQRGSYLREITNVLAIITEETHDGLILPQWLVACLLGL